MCACVNCVKCKSSWNTLLDSLITKDASLYTHILWLLTISSCYFVQVFMLMCVFGLCPGGSIKHKLWDFKFGNDGCLHEFWSMYHVLVCSCVEKFFLSTTLKEVSYDRVQGYNTILIPLETAQTIFRSCPWSLCTFLSVMLTLRWSGFNLTPIAETSDRVWV